MYKLIFIIFLLFVGCSKKTSIDPVISFAHVEYSINAVEFVDEFTYEQMTYQTNIPKFEFWLNKQIIKGYPAAYIKSIKTYSKTL